MGEMNREAGYKRSLADVRTDSLIAKQNTIEEHSVPQQSASEGAAYHYIAEHMRAGYNAAEIMIFYTRELAQGSQIELRTDTPHFAKSE